MNYQFENLGPDRFQELSQALLVAAYPDVQCFPVAQPDGGRDSLVYMPRGEFIVFQVKYVRKPLAEKDPHNWLVDILKDEAPKVSKLIPRGAKKYILITNVPGTAHLDSGSIDRLNEVLRDQIEIPSQCWWRDDVSRRLETNPDLRWSFPALITHGDLLKSLLESSLGEEAERRISTVRAAVRTQFEREKEVRFKQIELQNKLIDLFVDVPAVIRSGPKKRSREIDWIMRRDDDEAPGIAWLILQAQEFRLDAVVLEGGPGQGKSTVTQYICQIHRRQILEEPLDLPQIPESHRAVPIRLPLKVDLRDYALWLEKKNPFTPEDDESAPDDWHRSLESFLAAQIQYDSGGARFSVEDLQTLARSSRLLLVLDGLDEVGTQTLRHEVVTEATRASNRLREVSKSFQVVVTSRPAASTHAPAFSDSRFFHLELTSIPRSAIEEYSQKWLKARGLVGREAATVRKILNEKLDQPHLRELARNPMQLAILLSLIHTRGTSLPDKRTALYDAYMELFFSREAEKSAIVREHRELLIDIHRYLAWVLHAEAESARGRGSVTEERLRSLLLDYLVQEGHDDSIVGELFTGMVERVVALVSRVEGTFEFEVQPLREYFAARHLYETAAYAPVGVTKTGTLPDRFDALARNPFWRHVTRFFAGCYNKGELPSLVDRIEALAEEAVYRKSRYAQDIAVPFLCDWVFTQHPKSRVKMVNLLLAGIGLRNLLSEFPRRARLQLTLSLPKDCGRADLYSACLEEIKKDLPIDYAGSLCDTITENGQPDEIASDWTAHAKSLSGIQLTNWVVIGRRLGALARLSDKQVSDLLDDSEGQIRSGRIQALLTGGKRSYFEQDENRFNEIVDGILGREYHVGVRSNRLSEFGVLEWALEPFYFSRVWDSDGNYPLLAELRQFQTGNKNIVEELQELESLPYEASKKITSIRDRLLEEAQRSSREWARSLEPWNALIEEIRRCFGNCWGAVGLACLSAGIRSREERALEYSDLFDDQAPLAYRARYARLKSGGSSWWADQLEKAETSEHTLTCLLLLLTWSGPETMTRLIPVVDAKMESLTTEEWGKLYSAIRSIGRQAGGATLNVTPETVMHARSIVALANRFDADQRHDLYTRCIANYSGADSRVHNFAMTVGAELLESVPGDAIEIIRQAYCGGASAPWLWRSRHGYGRTVPIPAEIADLVLEVPEQFPSELVALAAHTFREVADGKARPLASIAEEEKWFEQ